MTMPRPDDALPAAAPTLARKPFVPPTVQDLGSLKVLTLVGGSL
ncbi:MAG TPA: hypothetical protein VFQ39_16410 [Longimicrobium sp.]|nr:hypothetical protein [Longimicrobium sp.]